MARKQNEPDACKARGFQKGCSGNPKGRPPIIREVQEMAKELTPALISNLFEIATNDKANASARVQASVALLDRGWGRPKQSVDVKVDHNASGIADAINAMQRRMLELNNRQDIPDKPNANIIDGEVVEVREINPRA